MTLTANYSSSIARSTISSSTSSTKKMSVKPCVAKGHRECVQGFLRDRCCKCTKGSIPCGMCPTDPSSSNSCIFCVDGRKECDDCYGAGFVQRICRDCIKQHYRQQQLESNTNSLLKVTEQSKTVVSNLSESFLQATVGFVKGVHSQAVYRTLSHDQKHRSGSSVSLPESIASSEHSTASAPSPSSSKGGFFMKRLSLDHERSAASPATASSSSKKSHRRKWSWSSILTAA
ncbi:hypothetical protein KI688_012865 [Linnemannia hyalina]|uniref:Uncharacterized protein n=1 Tax=Linnemannia hyalina TaxID=64524 RepID=A0A9P8BT89_9FUNG|nr:hypothetical protein KI688_012865 [Linnemannia hyalina]